jgi:hypothetical protein
MIIFYTFNISCRALDFEPQQKLPNTKTAKQV